MHIWTIEKWEQIYNDYSPRKGLRLIIDKDANSEVRLACIEFAKWLRTEYYFPVRVKVYIKPTEKNKG